MQLQVREIDADGNTREVSEVGLPVLFAPQEWDIKEEIQGSEALRDIQRQKEDFF